jgi:16S rRNA G966 N2-methylase RsmD
MAKSSQKATGTDHFRSNQSASLGHRKIRPNSDKLREVIFTLLSTVKNSRDEYTSVKPILDEAQDVDICRYLQVQQNRYLSQQCI